MQTIYTLIGIFCGVSFMAFICSLSVANGFKFHNCKGDGSCDQTTCKHDNETAKKILSLLDK